MTMNPAHRYCTPWQFRDDLEGIKQVLRSEQDPELRAVAIQSLGISGDEIDFSVPPGFIRRCFDGRAASDWSLHDDDG